MLALAFAVVASWPSCICAATCGPFHRAPLCLVGCRVRSYNRVNNTYACENPVTLGDLKSHSMLGFDGWIMSDW